MTLRGIVAFQVCINVLEHAKSIFSADKPSTQSKPKKSKKRKRKTSQDASDGKNKEDSAKWPRTQDENKTKIKPNNDLILVTKLGRPVRREGPKWDPERLTTETLFILGSRANKALGFGQTRGRLYMKHPELFKYVCFRARDVSRHFSSWLLSVLPTDTPVIRKTRSGLPRITSWPAPAGRHT